MIDSAATETAPPPPPTTECSICCETYNRSTRACVVCYYHDCGYAACKSCIQTYLTHTTQEPHCMNCKKPFSDEFMMKKLTKVYYKTKYKEHHKKILLDTEIAKIADTMDDAERFVKKEAIMLENAEHRQQLARLRAEMGDINRTINENHRKMNNLSNKPTEERRKFIMPCPNNDCRGFLSTAYKCGICNHHTCPKCLELIDHGAATAAAAPPPPPQHICKEECLKSAEALRRDTRPCPSCGTRIFKISGCSQMFCTECHVAFDWETGRIDSGAIHNPHYYEWLQAGGTAQPRAAAGECQLTDRWWNLRSNLTTRWKDYPDIIHYVKIFTNLHRTVEHVSNMNYREAQRMIRDLDDHKRERILYILKRMNVEELSNIIYKRTQQKKKITEKYHIFELIHNIGVDFFRVLVDRTPDNVLYKAAKDISAAEVLDYLMKKEAEIFAFFKYCNTQFERLSQLYNERALFFILEKEDEVSYDEPKYGFIMKYYRIRTGAAAAATEVSPDTELITQEE